MHFAAIMQAETLRRCLKVETRELHQHLDDRLSLLEPGLTLHRYGCVMQAFHGFYTPVEAGLERLMATVPPLGFPLRARGELIERDLEALGLSRREIAELPRCTDVPRLSCVEDLAGCLYVLEGACLGGQVIARSLRKRFDHAISFFVGDAEATSARWIAVLAWLDSVVRMGARSEEIVAAACATFQTLARWLERQGASCAERIDGRPD